MREEFYVDERHSAMNNEELVERFYGDIEFDCHGYRIRFERSHAQRELVKRVEHDRDILRMIVAFLRSGKKSIMEPHYVCWCMLLNNIEIVIDPEKSGPQSLRDTEAWLEWAEKFC